MLGTEQAAEKNLEALAQSARDDDVAFGTLARTVRTLVVRWTRAATGDHDEAEDVAQLVLLRLRRSLGEYSARGRFTTWLYRMTRNITVDRHRVDRRRQLLLASAHHDAQGHVRQHNENTDDCLLEVSETAPRLEALIRAFLDELSPRQQTVFERIDLNGESTADVAIQLGITTSTVRVLLMQARRTMRLHLLSQHPDLLRDYEP